MAPANRRVVTQPRCRPACPSRKSQAYNSLSIEGYRVTSELIERVAKGGWNPEKNEADEQSRDAMAARGYFWLDAAGTRSTYGTRRMCRRRSKPFAT